MDTPVQTISFLVFLKNLSYIAAGLAAIEYLQLSSTAIAMLSILLFVDFITGVLRAGIVDGPHTIKSSIGIRGASAKLLVILIPFILAIAGKGVGVSMTSLATASITIFIIATAYSIMGNIHSITTGKPKVEFDAVNYVYQQVGRMLKGIIKEDV